MCTDIWRFFKKHGNIEIYVYTAANDFYFEDADNDPDPIMYSGLSWNDIKDFFKREVSFVAKK